MNSYVLSTKNNVHVTINDEGANEMSKKQRIFLTIAVAYLIYNIVQNGLTWGNGLVTVLVLVSLYLSARYGNRKKTENEEMRTGKKKRGSGKRVSAVHAPAEPAEKSLENSGKQLPKS